jgi:hypothetical protein
MKLGVVAHTCNPSYSDGDWKDCVQGQPGQKVQECPISTSGTITVNKEL